MAEPTIQEKRCAICKVKKPISRFRKSKQQRDGHSCYCKPCFSLRWRAEHPVPESSTIDGEQWLAVVGYEGIYDVSDHGRIRRVLSTRGGRGGRILKLNKMNIGYFRVALYRDNSKTERTVHSIVADAFLGPRGSNQVNHKDGNKEHNHINNLEYVTAGDNIRHAVSIGLMPRGEPIGNSKLTSAKVIEIRTLLHTHTMRQIARLFGVSLSAIQHIKEGNTWKHI